MPRVLVIIIFATLTLGIVGGGAVLVWQNLSAPEADTGLGSEKKEGDGSLFGALPAIEQTKDQDVQQALTDSGDDDGDGLSNGDELVWGTDISNPDTDGDGYLDGEEVLANHDPNKPAPDDLLGVVEEEPVAGTQPEVIQTGLSVESVEKYFVDGLDISGGTDNLTDEYEAQFAEDERSPAVMREFADKKPILSQLPRPDRSVVPDTKNNSAGLIKQYLEVANNRNVLANSSSYTQAQLELYSQNNSSSMLGIANIIGVYRNQLQEVPVPEVALPTHLVLLGYTELLITTFEQIALWNDDPVKSMVATRQLETIDRKYYPIIQRELQRLEALQ